MDELNEHGGVSILTVNTPAGIRVAGFAIDGVDEVQVLTRSGATQVVPVEDNFFSVHVEGSPTEARWSSPEGAERAVLATSQ